MKLVVDASVAVAWFVSLEGVPDLSWMLAEKNELNVPDLIFPEISNACWRLVQGGYLPKEYGPVIVQQLARTVDHVWPCGPLAKEATIISLELGHPAYDCFYLALAAQEQTQMVTLDKRLLNKLRGTAYRSLAISSNDFAP